MATSPPRLKKKLLFSTFALVIFGLLFTGSCKHEPQVGPTPNPDDCDTSKVTYPGSVYPILDKNCIGCHGGAAPSAGLNFTDYNTVATIAYDGRLLGVINHAAGYSPMPPTGVRLSDCDIATIEIWVRDTTFNIPPNGIPCDPDTAYFLNTIFPLLQSSCAISGCHDAATAADGVNLTTYTSIINTADVDPYNPQSSDLYEVITENDPDKRMPPPPRNPLNDDQIDAVYLWIMQGALNNYCDEIDCDSINVTYSGTVFPIIQNNCLGCHSGGSPSGGIFLETHANLVAVANTGQLLGVIRHQQGYPAMPPSGVQLSDCNIAQIQKWINDGTPNN